MPPQILETFTFPEARAGQQRQGPHLASPPPLDDPSVSNPLECPRLHWGILGCGRVSHDFVQALKHIPSARVVACAARRAESAADFAAKHGIDKSYGSYEAMLADEEVQCVYVGNLHKFRRPIGEMCLMANKHTLLEKPIACNAEDAEYLINLARERNLFLMEGMWTRFFPAVEQARRLVSGGAYAEKADLDENDESAMIHGNLSGNKMTIGDVVNVVSDFNFDSLDNDEYPNAAIFNHGLGGGASYAIGSYPIAAATCFFGGSMPKSVKAVGEVDEQTGVDLQAAVVLKFGSNTQQNRALNTPKQRGNGTACLTFGLLGESSEETTVIGTKGRLTLRSPGHCPTNLSVTFKGEGRGNVEAEVEYHYPLPEDTEEIRDAGGYYYPNSAGFAYEAAAVARCIASGKKETPQYTLHESLVNMRVLDASRSQLGVEPI